MEIKGIEELGTNLANIAREWGAEVIENHGGSHFIARKGDEELRMLADEGDGAIEGEDGFEEAWDA